MSDTTLAIVAGILILIEYVALVVAVWQWTDFGHRDFQLVSMFFLPLIAMSLLAPGTVAGLILIREFFS